MAIHRLVAAFAGAVVLALSACGSPADPGGDTQQPATVGVIEQAERLDCSLVLCLACPEGTVPRLAPGQCCPRCFEKPPRPHHCGNDAQCAGCTSPLQCIGSCECVDGECAFVCDSTP